MNTVCLQLVLLFWCFSWFSSVPVANIKLHQTSMNTACLQFILISWCFSWFPSVPIANTKLYQTSTNTACLQLILISWGFSRFPSISAINTVFNQNVNLQVLHIRRSGLSCSFCFSQSLGILPSSRPHHHPRKYFSTPLPRSSHSTLRNLGSWYETHTFIRAFY